MTVRFSERETLQWVLSCIWIATVVVNSAYLFINQAQTQKKKKHKSKSGISSSDLYSVSDISEAFSDSSDMVDDVNIEGN